ncbi:heavy metal transporter [Kitasatospora putterlickiae]|uniref:Heavy metal transporter n=1 Tax=Kitasatospora putterlickiae TaxID=221725 RepID=A0ABN1YGL3_9ACTN
MLIGLLVLAVVAVAVFWLRDNKLLTPEGCSVKTPAGEGTLELPQTANAATIAAVAHARGLPDRAVTISLATAMQESKIRNLTGGDRDSVGLFQQRPSQGWGTVQQIMDPVYATNKFLDGLVKVPGYTRLPLTDAAQQVQKSGYPQAYAKHETKATLLASALTGREAASLNCVVHDFAAPDDGEEGATPAAAPDRAQVLSDRVRREFGRTVTPATGHASTIKGAENAVALTPDPTASTDSGPDAERQNGWAVAHWAVSQAQKLGIETVAYDGRIWRKAKSEDGWKPQPTGTSTKLVLVSLAAPGKA